MSRRWGRVGALLTWPICACAEAPLDAVALPPNDLDAELADGLIAHWSLDEIDQGVVEDDSGNEHHGQVSGGSSISDGRFAGGLHLARGDSVTVTSFPDAAPNFTVGFWIRLSAEQLAMNDDTWVAIVGAENFFAGGWQVNIDNRLTRPRFDFAYWAPPLEAYVFVECECVEIDRWMHLAAVVDVEADSATLYVDGSIGDQETRPSDIPPGDSTLYVGRWNMDGRLLSADLDDLAVWSRALSPSEISALQTRSLTGGERSTQARLGGWNKKNTR